MYTNQLVGMDAGEDWLFKASLLTTMTNVVKVRSLILHLYVY